MNRIGSWAEAVAGTAAATQHAIAATTAMNRLFMVSPICRSRRLPSALQGDTIICRGSEYWGKLGMTGLLGGRRSVDLTLEDLPGRAFRQLLHEPDDPRVLVGGDPLL